jgi:hypothetical protein
MSVQGVSRVAAGISGAVVCLVVVGGVLLPVRSGSAHPVRLEPGRWYDVAPTADLSTTPASATGHIAGAQNLTAVTPITQHQPAGKTAWLAAFGCVAILAAGWFRSALPVLKTSSRRTFARAAAIIEGRE